MTVRDDYDQVMMRFRSSVNGNWLVVASCIAALVATVVVLTIGFGYREVIRDVQTESGATGEPSQQGAETSSDDHIGGSSNEVSRNGLGRIVASSLVFSTPVLVAGAPLIGRKRRSVAVLRWGSSLLLAGWVLFLAFGGGIFYVPAVILMMIAAALASDESRAKASPPGEDPSM